MTPSLRERAVLRARCERALRDHFDRTEVLEIHVPSLVLSPGLDRYIRAFQVPTVDAHGFGHRFLHTSPEFAIKATLAELGGDVFTLCRAYRDEPLTAQHHPEFTMLEWYRQGVDYTTLMDDCEHIVAAVLGACGGDTELPPFERVTVHDAFMKSLGVPATCDAKTLVEACLARGVDADPTWDWDTAFTVAYAELVEPSLPAAPTFLYAFPKAMAALARLCPDDPTVAERFELYLPTTSGPIEIANAFSELVDPVSQRARFEADIAARAAQSLPPHPMPEAMLDGLIALGPTAGIALGWERLLRWAARVGLGWDTTVADWLVGIE